MVSPGVAVISAGRDNSFGHPHKETLDALQGARIFRTDIDGAIKIKESINGLEVKIYKDFQFKKARSFNDEGKNIKRLFEAW
jgi:beta-lactamase superfamily II metal-dependent hydrolase